MYLELFKKVILLVNSIKKKAIFTDTHSDVICGTNHFTLLLSLSLGSLFLSLWVSFYSIFEFLLSSFSFCLFPFRCSPFCRIFSIPQLALYHFLCPFIFSLVVLSPFYSLLPLQLASDKTKSWKTRRKLLNSSHISFPLNLFCAYNNILGLALM